MYKYSRIAYYFLCNYFFSKKMKQLVTRHVNTYIFAKFTLNDERFVQRVIKCQELLYSFVESLETELKDVTCGFPIPCAVSTNVLNIINPET